jgi:hypothetical protein
LPPQRILPLTCRWLIHALQHSHASAGVGSIRFDNGRSAEGQWSGSEPNEHTHGQHTYEDNDS